MRNRGIGKWAFALGMIGAGLGAAPAAPSYQEVDRTINRVRTAWAVPGVSDPNAPGWNAFFDALKKELHTYSTVSDANSQLVSLNSIYKMSTALEGIAWPPALELRENLRAWLRPRVRLAWAGRRLIDSIHSLTNTTDSNVNSNRERWVRFVENDLGAALRRYDAADTVAKRLEGLKGIYGSLASLQVGNQARPWVPSLELERALNDLYNLPNLDISADVATLTPVLSNDLIQTGPIYRKGYVSQVTAGPKTGFGLLWSDQGIAFYNKQIATSVTPITDFQNQMMQDPQGRRAAKLYYFSATSQDVSETTVVAVLGPNGLQLGPQYTHNTDAFIGSLKQSGKGLGRFVASIVGFNQQRMTQKVYEGAIDKIRQNVVQESAELGGEKIAQAAAEQNAKIARYLIGNNMLALGNLLVTGLSLRSRPENALIGGTIQWRGAADQIGAYEPQPSKFGTPESGVSADLHLSSIMTSLTRGYLQSDAVKDLHNLMIVTKKVAPNTPPREGIAVSRNADYPTYLKAVGEARAANDPKVLAIRVKRPGHSPEFAADANGHLVALVHDFQIEVPAPPQAARGGLFGPPAQVYRIEAPRAEVVISFKVTPDTQNTPVRLSGRIEAFDPGPNARVVSVNEDESKAQPLTAFTSTFVLNFFKTKIQGQPIDIPLSNLQLRGFAIRQVSSLDPSGWIRVNLVRTSNSPAAGIQ